MIKAYFFDWCATLSDFKDVIPLKKNLNPKEYESLFVTKEFNDLDLIGQKREMVLNALHNAEIKLYPDTERTIRKLKEDNFRLAIVSNTYTITPLRFRKMFREVINYFDITTFSSEIGIKKPDPEIFLYTLNKLNNISNLNIKFNEVMMVGDSYKYDIKPALNLGMQTRIIDRTKQNLEDII